MQVMHIPKKKILTNEIIRNWEVLVETLPGEIKQNEESIVVLKENQDIAVVRKELAEYMASFEEYKAILSRLESRIEIINKIDSLNELKRIEHKNAAEIAKISPYSVLIASKIEPYTVEIKKLSLYIDIKKAKQSLQEKQQYKAENEARLAFEKKSLRIIEDQLKDVNSEIKTFEKALVQLDKDRKKIDEEINHQWKMQETSLQKNQHLKSLKMPLNTEMKNDEIQRKWKLESNKKESIFLQLSSLHNAALIQKPILLNSLQERGNNIAICNRNILAAQRSINEKHALLSAQEASIIRFVEKLDLTTLEHRRDEAAAKRTELSDNKDKIILHIQSLDNETKCAKSQISEIQQRIDFLSQNAEPYKMLDSSAVISLLENARNENVRLNKEIADRQKIVAKHANDVSNLEAKAKYSQSHLQNLNEEKYLVSLKYHPQVLIDTLVDEIQKSYDAFDENNPVGQSDEVRICLMEKNHVIQHILGKNVSTSDNDFQPGEFKSLLENPAVMKYYQLCGYLHHIKNRIGYPQKNQGFGELIASILGDCTLDPNECQKAFRVANPPEKNKADMIDHVDSEYKKAEAILRDLLLNAPEKSKTLAGYVKATIVLKTVCENKPTKDIAANIEKIDFSRRILENTYAVLNNSHDSIVHDKCRKLASHHVVGQSSWWKKILGPFLMFLGTAMCIAGIVGITGVASPALIAGGAAVALIGFGLFHTRASQMDGFLQAAKKLPPESMLPDRNNDSLPTDEVILAPSAPSYSLLIG